MSWQNATHGCVLFRDANGWTDLGPGSAGQVLQCNGPGQNPSWVNAGGGSDPWTYVRITSDFTTTSATAVNVTDMAFTPSANTRYEFEASLYLQTATAATGPRPGLTAGPTGLTRAGARISAPSSATAEIIHNWRGQAGSALSTGLPTANVDYLGSIFGAIVAGASPSGTIQVTLHSETAGTTVRIMAGSFLKYRTVP